MACSIGIGAWLGTIMLFNVWVLIWPNQKKVLGLVAATEEQTTKARRKVAMLASRTNFVLSIPMLHGMVGRRTRSDLRFRPLSHAPSATAERRLRARWPRISAAATSRRH